MGLPILGLCANHNLKSANMPLPSRPCIGFPPDNGPYPGGNSVTLTNDALGNGSDITNVLVGGVAATIEAQGANWVRITMPANVIGTTSILVQSTSVGNTTLTGVYTYTHKSQADDGFDPVANHSVRCLAVQTNGQILVGGEFTTLAGYTRNFLGRLNADGSLDTTFTNEADRIVYALAVQPDGKILVGGDFHDDGRGAAQSSGPLERGRVTGQRPSPTAPITTCGPWPCRRMARSSSAAPSRIWAEWRAIIWPA